MSLPDYEPCTLWFEAWPEARKDHVCASCGRKIPRGAQHRIVDWLYEGEWSRARQCFGCAWHVFAILGEHDDRGDPLLQPPPSDMASWVHELLDWYGEESDEPIVRALRDAAQHLSGVGEPLRPGDDQ